VEDLTLPEGFLRFSDAVDLLAQGIWGGLQRPIPVRKFKRQYKKTSVGFGPWKEKAGKCLRSAALDGKVPVYVFGTPQSEIGDLSPEITPVPVIALRRLIPIRGSLPDHPRASMKAAGGDGKLFRSLNTGLLLVRRSQFDAWYQRERAKRRWPSQRSTSKRRDGRPSVQTDDLRTAVINAMRERKTSIAALRRRLVGSGRADIPSLDTLERLVDQLYRETGEAEFFRMKRTRRKRT
jgi:hypothetical protein